MTQPESVNRIRAESIQQLLDLLYNLVDALGQNAESCTFAEDCVLLGALLKQMAGLGIPWSRPEEPFSGFSVAHIADGITSLQTPRFCPNDTPLHSEVGFYGKRKKSRKQFCDEEPIYSEPRNLHDLLAPEIEHLINGISGLDLADHSR